MLFNERLGVLNRIGFASELKVLNGSMLKISKAAIGGGY
jgi:hypothetical protein